MHPPPRPFVAVVDPAADESAPTGAGASGSSHGDEGGGLTLGPTGSCLSEEVVVDGRYLDGISSRPAERLGGFHGNRRRFGAAYSTIAAALCVGVAVLPHSNSTMHNVIVHEGENSRVRTHSEISVDTTSNVAEREVIYRHRHKRMRRRLSSPSSHPSCPERSLAPPKVHIHYLLNASTYAASFPGTGSSLITKHVVEALTGMLTGDAGSSPTLERMKVQKMDRTGFARGQGEVVALRTEFPHSRGKLAAWDDRVTRAFVILRNPLDAIPCHFDRMYEMNGHLPAGTASRNSDEVEAAWIKWRDNQYSDQLLLYRRFVSFWMERYLGRDGVRMFFLYEEVVGEDKGAKEAARLASFLREGVKGSAVDVTPSDADSKGAAAAEGVGS